jgi:pimeloyl-ACP methyl ester carboxylesterase
MLRIPPARRQVDERDARPAERADGRGTADAQGVMPRDRIPGNEPMTRANKTPPFLGPDGEVIPGSIAEAGYIQFGGLEQWVMIRGENVANPVLVVLHGGPGFSDTAFLRYHTPELEKTFTVVYWDQRGAGRSFNPRADRQDLTIARVLAVRGRFVVYV